MSKPKKKMRGHKNSCGTKKAFETYDSAYAASLRGRWEFMQVYKCKKCKKYHYGHPTGFLDEASGARPRNERC